MNVYFDLETDLIRRGRLAPDPVCMSWAVDDGPVQLGLWSDVESLFIEWLQDDNVTLIGANTAFDTTCPCGYRPSLTQLVKQKYAKGLVRDVLYDAKLLDIAGGRYAHAKGRGWSLEAMAARRGVKMEKDAWRLRYSALRRVSVQDWPTGAVFYSKEDTNQTRLTHLENEREAQVWRDTQGLEVLGHHSARVAAAADSLHWASCWGVPTDPGRTAKLETSVSAHLEEIRAELQAAKLVRANGTKDTKAAAQRMLDACAAQGRTPALTKGGEQKRKEGISIGLRDISLDRDACILAADDVLIAYADYTTSSTLLGRVEAAKSGFVLPLQTRFDALKGTARTSSSGPELQEDGSGTLGVQMQNFPRGKKDEAIGLRETFTPRPGNCFIGADLSLAELHALAEFCYRKFGYTKLGQLLNAGTDVHWYFGGKLRGLTIEEVKALPDADEARSMAKPFNFGVPGGMGPDKIILYARKGYGVKLTRESARENRALWLNTFDEVQCMFDWVSSMLERRRSFTHVHPVTGYVRGGCGYTDGCNEAFQHLTAYGAKDALVQVDHSCFDDNSPLFGFRIWNFVHDEILLEGPIDRASAAADELSRIMEQAYNAYVPNFPTHVDPVVMPWWSKKAKSKKVEGIWQMAKLVR